MQLIIILILIAFPLLEIGLLIKAGQWLGMWWMLAVILGTFVLGLAALTREGFSAPFKVQEALRSGEGPIEAIMDGTLAATAGVLLMTPGFISDALGLALLVPPFRRLAGRWIGRKMVLVDISDTTRRGSSRPRPGGRDPEPPRSSSDPDTGPVIDGEFERLDERPIDRGRRPG
jgi:UPF0716 protein FxsA